MLRLHASVPRCLACRLTCPSRRTFIGVVGSPIQAQQCTQDEGTASADACLLGLSAPPFHAHRCTLRTQACPWPTHVYRGCRLPHPVCHYGHVMCTHTTCHMHEQAPTHHSMHRASANRVAHGPNELTWYAVVRLCSWTMSSAPWQKGVRPCTVPRPFKACSAASRLYRALQPAQHVATNPCNQHNLQTQLANTTCRHGGAGTAVPQEGPAGPALPPGGRPFRDGHH